MWWTGYGCVEEDGNDFMVDWSRGEDRFEVWLPDWNCGKVQSVSAEKNLKKEKEMEKRQDLSV